MNNIRIMKGWFMTRVIVVQSQIKYFRAIAPVAPLVMPLVYEGRLIFRRTFLQISCPGELGNTPRVTLGHILGLL